MSDLISTLISADVEELQTLLGDMFQPAAACVLVLGSVLPVAGLAEALCLLVRLLAGGGRRDG